MVVWWQRGGAAHSANEQEGKEGREGLNFDPCCFYVWVLQTKYLSSFRLQTKSIKYKQERKMFACFTF